LTVLTEYDIL